MNRQQQQILTAQTMETGTCGVSSRQTSEHITAVRTFPLCTHQYSCFKQISDHLRASNPPQISVFLCQRSCLLLGVQVWAGGDYHSLLSGGSFTEFWGNPWNNSAHRWTEIQPKSPTPLDLSLTQFGGGILWVWVSWKHQLHKGNLQQQSYWEETRTYRGRQADVD